MIRVILLFCALVVSGSTVHADGELLELRLAGWTPGAVGASEPAYVKPVASAAEAYYEVTVDQIRLITNAQDLRIHTSGFGLGTFELWNGQQAAFASAREFLRRIDH